MYHGAVEQLRLCKDLQKHDESAAQVADRFRFGMESPGR